jgi:DNA-binding CsgD family transcriptional regulator
MALSASYIAMFMVDAIRLSTSGPAQAKTRASANNAFQSATVFSEIELNAVNLGSRGRAAALAAVDRSKTQAARTATARTTQLRDTVCWRSMIRTLDGLPAEPDDGSTLGSVVHSQEYAIVLMAQPCCRGVPSAVEDVMAESISALDLVALRGLLDMDHVDDSHSGLPWQLMTKLRELFHCDYVELDRTNTAAQQFVFEQTLSDVQECNEACGADAADPVTAAYWKLYWLTSACNYPDRTGDIVHVTKLSDFLSEREWRTSPMYLEFGVPGQSRQMAVYFPDEPGHTMRLMLWRGRGRDFSERDRLLLTLLRPHLIAAYRNAERRRRAPAVLTPRQLELLQHVAQGYTNRQVARRMGLSEGTVRTHLNHVYERLGVTSRTAAVTRMSSTGLE